MAEKSSVPVKTEERQVRRWDPFDMLEEMRADLARFWGEGWPFLRMPAPARLGGMAWAPRMDVFEKNGDLVVKAELPGMAKDDIHVSVDDGALVIQGERKSESEVKDEAYYRIERSYGAFYRRLPLPPSVKPEAITAEYKDGVLEVHVPKPAEAESKAKPIPIG
jgi:HSP20 family protein